MKEINIDSFTVRDGASPFVIAEMSGNHNQSLDRALLLVEAAASAGAHAIKLQTYTADTLTYKGNHPDFSIQDKQSPWYGQTLHNLYQKAYTPWEWHGEIFSYAKSKGLIAFSSPFDETAVDFLESLNVPAYKIASFENTHFPLLKKVAQTGKPVIMSTGVTPLEELKESVHFLRKSGCKNLILLKCTSTYPASPIDSHLRTIPHMRELFDSPVGISDHTLGISASLAAVALGACVIEKHLTLKRADGGVDSSFSLEPSEFKSLTEEAEKAFQALGRVNYDLSEKETKSRMYKRSIFVVKSVKKGQRIEKDHLQIIRPSTGLSSKHYEEVQGKIAAEDIEAGTPLQWSMIL